MLNINLTSNNAYYNKDGNNVVYTYNTSNSSNYPNVKTKYDELNRMKKEVFMNRNAPTKSLE